MLLTAARLIKPAAGALRPLPEFQQPGRAAIQGGAQPALHNFLQAA